MSAEASDLEDKIVEEFLTRVNGADEVSDRMVQVLESVANEEAFGGREYLQERAMEVKGIDGD